MTYLTCKESMNILQTKRSRKVTFRGGNEFHLQKNNLKSR